MPYAPAETTKLIEVSRPLPSWLPIGIVVIGSILILATLAKT